jgi:DNA-binding NtrC family response regulator
MSELFILIVDDDLIYTNKIKDYIDFDGQYNLSVANSSFEAYNYLKIQIFDLVVIDPFEGSPSMSQLVKSISRTKTPVMFNTHCIESALEISNQLNFKVPTCNKKFTCSYKLLTLIDSILQPRKKTNCIA